jgi:TatD DNase family protein
MVKMFIDVHSHLEMFSDPEELVKDCVSQGTKAIISSSVDLNSMKKNIELSQKFDEIECCLGIHPSNILSMQEKEILASIEFLEENLSFAKGIGEIGIDFKHANSNEKKQKQIQIYRKQLLIAEENNLPVVIHSRYAEKRSLDILSSFNGKVLLHWFDGNKKSFQEGIEKNYFFSVGPSILFNKEYLQKTLLIPLDNLMLETDSPVEFAGEKAKPFWVKKVAEKLSAERKIPLKEIEEKTTKNAKEFFSL